MILTFVLISSDNYQNFPENIFEITEDEIVRNFSISIKESVICFNFFYWHYDEFGLSFVVYFFQYNSCFYLFIFINSYLTNKFPNDSDTLNLEKEYLKGA